MFNIKKHKGDDMKRILTKVVTFLFYKSERKLPEIQISLMKP